MRLIYLRVALLWFPPFLLSPGYFPPSASFTALLTFCSLGLRLSPRVGFRFGCGCPPSSWVTVSPGLGVVGFGLWFLLLLPASPLSSPSVRSVIASFGVLRNCLFVTCLFPPVFRSL